MPDQRSLTDQLKDVIRLATQNGLYDAADWITQNYSLFRCRCGPCSLDQPLSLDGQVPNG